MLLLLLFPVKEIIKRYDFEFRWLQVYLSGEHCVPLKTIPRNIRYSFGLRLRPVHIKPKWKNHFISQPEWNEKYYTLSCYI